MREQLLGRVDEVRMVVVFVDWCLFLKPIDYIRDRAGALLAVQSLVRD